MKDFFESEVNLPDKLYFRIGEVAELTGLPTYVLRFWESEFPGIRPKRTDSGQRMYRRSDVEFILTIRHLLHDRKFTIRGARQYLRDRRRQKDSKEIVEMMRRELESIRRLLD
jgi:DNA-binding transcriptional MerR regulator